MTHAREQLRFFRWLAAVALALGVAAGLRVDAAQPPGRSCGPAAPACAISAATTPSSPAALRQLDAASSVAVMARTQETPGAHPSLLTAGPRRGTAAAQAAPVRATGAPFEPGHTRPPALAGHVAWPPTGPPALHA